MHLKKYAKWCLLFTLVITNSGFGQKQEKLRWTELADLPAKQAAAPRAVIIDLYTDWCGWCKVMDKRTYGNPSVAAYLNRYFYVVKFNAESRAPILWKGKTYRYNQRYGAHELAVHLTQGALAYPTTVFIPTQSNDSHVVAGFLPVKEFEVLATYFGQSENQKTDLQTYMRSYLPRWK